MAKANQRLEIPLLAQVNLLPPEVEEKRARVNFMKLAGVIAGVGIIAAVGWGIFTEMQVSNAEEELNVELNRGTKLLVEKQKYAEVPIVLDQLTRSKTAEIVGMATEVNWKSYTDGLIAVLPEGSTIDTIGVEAMTLLESAPASDESLAPEDQHIGQMIITGRSPVVPDSGTWLTALEQIPGFIQPRLAVSTYDAPSPNQESYTFTITIQLTPDIYSNRFITQGETQE